MSGAERPDAVPPRAGPGTLLIRLQNLAGPHAPSGLSVLPEGIEAFSLVWDAETLPHDPRVPVPLLHAIADTCCSLGQVTLVSDALGLEGASSRYLRAAANAAVMQWQDCGHYRHAMLASPVIGSAPWALVETRQPGVVQQLWTLAARPGIPSQAVCLTPAHAAPLQLAPPMWSALLAQQFWPAMLAALDAAQVQAVCLPGRAGASLSCIFLRSDLARQFVAGLRRHAVAQLWTLHDASGQGG